MGEKPEKKLFNNFFLNDFNSAGKNNGSKYGGMNKLVYVMDREEVIMDIQNVTRIWC